MCDTNGGTLPWETGSIVEDIRQHSRSLGFMCITIPPGRRQYLMAVAPVSHVQGTVNGYGERWQCRPVQCLI